MTDRERPPRGPGRSSESFPLGTRCLKLALWPVTDRAAWTAALKISGPLSPRGPAVGWADATRKKRSQEWGRFLAFLASAGELDPAETPGERLTAVRLGQYIRSLRERQRDSTVHCEIIDLSYMIAALAPGASWAWVRRDPNLPTRAEIRASAKPIEPFNAEQFLASLLDRCDQIDELPLTPENAVPYRDGVLIALAISSSLRRRNLAEMRMGEHVLIGEDHIRLYFPDSVKNRAVIDVLVPRYLEPYLRAYITKYRPVLLQGAEDTGALWINIHGLPLAYEAVANVFKSTSRRLIGRPVNVHLTRHTMATAIMDLDPRDLEVAAAALAHHGTGSANEVYDRSGNLAAQRIWTKLARTKLKDLRKRLTPKDRADSDTVATRCAERRARR